MSQLERKEWLWSFLYSPMARVSPFLSEKGAKNGKDQTDQKIYYFFVSESEHTETVAGDVSAEHSSSHTSVNKRATQTVTSPEDVIPLGRKLALAVGAAPLSLPIVSATVFITLFLLDVCLLKPRYSSVVLLVGRSFDAISDPIVGFLVNKTQRKGSLPLTTQKYFSQNQSIEA